MRSAQDLERELERQRRLAQASVALHATLDLDDLLENILQSAAEGVGADRGTVFLLSDDGAEIWSRVLQGDERLTIRLPVGKGIAGTVAQTGRAIRIVDAYADSRFDASWDQRSGYRTRQILCAPIRNRKGVTIGVFQLLNKASGDFDASDEAFLDGLSTHAALALENAVLHRSAIEKERQDREIHLVQEVQRAIQPERTVQAVGGLRMVGLNVLCEDASGDYYDLFDLRDGRMAVAIGDVSGHGLHAALVMVQARAFLRAICRTVTHVDEVANLLNDFLARDLTRGSFLTLFLGAVASDTGVLEWVSAGHLPALLWRRSSGDIEPLLATGRVVGVFAGAGYRRGSDVTLREGDVLLLYTDGATEATNPAGEQFGESRLRHVLRGAGSSGPEAVVDAVRERILAWTQSPSLRDDLTLVALVSDLA